MLLILGLLVLMPCLALLISFLLSPGGKSGGNKKNDGVKVSPLLPPSPTCCSTAGAGSEGLRAMLAVSVTPWADVGMAVLVCSRATGSAPASTGNAQEALQGGEPGEQAGAGGACRGNLLLFRGLQNVLAPSEGERLGQEKATRDRRRQLCSPKPQVQPGSRRLMRWMAASPAHHSSLPSAAGGAGLIPQLLSHLIPKGWCASGWHMGVFNPLGSTADPLCLVQTEQGNLAMFIRANGLMML